MDEALWGGAKGIPLEPLNLDMRIQKDWGTPESGFQPKSTTVKPARTIHTPSQTPSGHRIRQPLEHTRPVSEPTPPPSPPPVSLLRRPVWVACLLILLCGLGLLSFTPARVFNPVALLAAAGQLHAGGDYQGALKEYAALRQIEGAVSGSGKARLSFLEAGAAESLWKQGIEPGKNFMLALQRYDEAIQNDQTPMRVYASEALMARAEMNATQALASEPHDASAALAARLALEILLETPEYGASPAVALGIAHRRLAELIRAEDPQKAVDLLLISKDRQGSCCEGVEDLLIAQIYHEYLKDDDRAYEFYSLVKANPLASKENRHTAEEALVGIGGTDLQKPDTLDARTLEKLPLLKAD